MEYEDRITCFIDLIGFKSAINQSLVDEGMREYLYNIIHELHPSKFGNDLYGDIPVYLLDEDNMVKPSREVFAGKAREQFSDAYPLDITQFSDSFVISCPANNSQSCGLLLKAIYIIHLMFFKGLCMMMRGGITKGKLVHEESGALFGPAMNDAYELESKHAIYPRVVISDEAATHLHEMLKENPILSPLKKAFDGYEVIDIVSIFSWNLSKVTDHEEIERHINAIERDITENHKKSLPKVSYIKTEWNAFKAAT